LCGVTHRQDLPCYVYDWFLTKYGLRKIAEQQLLKMFAVIALSGKLVVDKPSGPTAAGSQDKDLEAPYLFMFGRFVVCLCVHDTVWHTACRRWCCCLSMAVCVLLG
jgi:hypothetical protein